MLPIRYAAGLLAAGVLSLSPWSGAGAADGHLPGELVDRTTLRVCSDPDNLPYSNEASEGFENKIAELFAEKVGVDLAYTWYPSSVGFVRNTLVARRCDLVMGVPTTNELMQNSNPYYRSAYALVQRADADPQVTSLHDPALAEMKIGGVARTPPITVLARAGLAKNLTPYQLMVDTRHDHPAQRMVEDVAAGTIDIAVVWGPIGGYFAKKQPVPLVLTPLVSDEESGVRLDFMMSMGLRRGEPEWKNRLNALIRENSDEIEKILLDYGVPLLDRQGQPIPPADSKQGALAPEPSSYRMADYRAPVPATLAGARVVTTAELQALIETADPVLVDVMPAPRKPEDSGLWLPPKRDHLPGSVWLANTGYGELSAEFERYFRDNLQALAARAPGRPLVFYCEPDCWMSWNAAKRAISLGYKDVVWYPEGAGSWKAAGLPLAPAEPLNMPDFVALEAKAAAQSAN